MYSLFLLFIAGIVAGANHMAMLDTLNYRASAFNHGIGMRIFDTLALMGVIASIFITYLAWNDIGFFWLIPSFAISGGIGYRLGDTMLKSFFGGIFPLLANLFIICLAIYSFTNQKVAN